MEKVGERPKIQDVERQLEALKTCLDAIKELHVSVSIGHQESLSSYYKSHVFIAGTIHHFQNFKHALMADIAAMETILSYFPTQR